MSDEEPKAGPDKGPTGPSDPDEMKILEALYGPPGEDGVFRGDGDGDEWPE